MMIGERLFDLRKDMGITQKMLADNLNVSNYTISSYELNKSEPNDEMKVKIAKFFNVSIDYLLGLVDEEIPYTEDDNSIIRVSTKLPAEAKHEIKEFIRFHIRTKYKL